MRSVSDPARPEVARLSGTYSCGAAARQWKSLESRQSGLREFASPWITDCSFGQVALVSGHCPLRGNGKDADE